MRWLALLAVTSAFSLHLGQTVVLPNAKLGDRISCSGLHGRVAARVTSRRAVVERDYLLLTIRPLFQGGVAAQCWYTRKDNEAPPVGFEPQAATFATTRLGWELGVERCWRCVTLRRTTDGGRTWEPLAGRGAIRGNDIRFADAENGFVFGPTLYATHAGGASWSRIHIPPVQQLEIGRGYAFATTSGTPRGGNVAELWRSRIGTDAWRVVGQFSAPFGVRLAVAGHVVAVMRAGYNGPGADSSVTSSEIWASRVDGDRWQRYGTPCRVADGGPSALAIAVGDTNRWLVDCFDGLQSSQEQHTRHHLYGCAHFGRGWRRLSDPSSTGAPGILAAVGSKTILLTTQGAIDLVHASFDGGRHFRVLIGGDGSDHEWLDLAFVDRHTGFLVRPTVAGVSVLRTDDGGRRWRTIDVG